MAKFKMGAKRQKFNISVYVGAGKMQTEPTTGYFVKAAGFPGITFMVHREPGEKHWALSEFRTGRRIDRGGDTRKDVITGGLVALQVRGIDADKIKNEAWPIYPAVN